MQALLKQHDEQRAQGPRRQWVNPLPGWIVEHEAYRSLTAVERLVLQGIADACDAPDARGDMLGAWGGQQLIHAIGCSRSWFFQARKRLEDLSFIILVARGGCVRLHTRSGVVNAANTWGIPGSPGALDFMRVAREAVRLVQGPDGRRERCVTLPGAQSAFWNLGSRHRGPQPASGENSLARGGVVRPPDYPSPVAGLPPSGERTLPSPLPSPYPSPSNNHDHGGAALTGKGGEGSKVQRFKGSREVGRTHPRFEALDLTETARLFELFSRFHAAGWVADGERDLLWFFSAAEHALRVGDRNPCGLFVSLIRDRERCELFVSQGDEDRGRARIKAGG